MLYCLSGQILHVNVSSFVTIYGDYSEAGHYCTSRVGPVRANWDQAYVTMALTDAFLIFFNREEPSVLTLGTTVWLKAYVIEVSNHLEFLLQIQNHLPVALRLVHWSIRMHVCHLRP